LDFEKAFDTVPHNRLVEKLIMCGITENLLEWIRDFLANRKTVNGNFSEWFDVLNGVPQCSVLGLLLFFIFVNDLPQWIRSSTKMFADDTKMWAIIRKKEDTVMA
jgi:ribonucleases P/MRP protein subunit RPP40